MGSQFLSVADSRGLWPRASSTIQTVEKGEAAVILRLPSGKQVEVARVDLAPPKGSRALVNVRVHLSVAEIPPEVEG